MKFTVYVHCNILDDTCHISTSCLCIKLYKRIKFIPTKTHFSSASLLYNDIRFRYPGPFGTFRGILWISLLKMLFNPNYFCKSRDKRKTENDINNKTSRPRYVYFLFSHHVESSLTTFTLAKV